MPRTLSSSRKSISAARSSRSSSACWSECVRASENGGTLRSSTARCARLFLRPRRSSRADEEPLDLLLFSFESMEVFGQHDPGAALPPNLALLQRLSRDLRWTWRPSIRALFSSLDPGLWIAARGNPAAFLRRVSPERLQGASADPAFLKTLYGLASELAFEDTAEPLHPGVRGLTVGRARLAAFSAGVGRISLFLLAAGLPENDPEDRLITARLYAGDQEMRIRQEIVLGMGGLKALKKLGLTPSIRHINEGHAAFAVLERIRELVSVE